MTEKQDKKTTRLIFGAWTACAAGVIIALLLIGPGEKTEPQVPAETEKTETLGQYGPAKVESPEPAISDESKRRIDYALLQALMLTGYGPDSIKIDTPPEELLAAGNVPPNVLEIKLDGRPGRYVSELSHALEKWEPEAELAREDENAWIISLQGRVTHRLLMPGIMEPEASGRMAVVIDDLGRDLIFAGELAALDLQVTFSILPREPHSSETADRALAAGREIILHQPMEPIDYPNVDPGPGALLTEMTPEQIRSELSSNLAVISMAKGVNNHTGSRFTQVESALSPVMEELVARKLFFLDSLTTSKSAVGDVAKKHGLAYYKRSIFLDNVRETDLILAQLKKAERIARISGQAIAIGHPYPETLEALKVWQLSRSGDVQVVSVSELEPAHRP